MNSKDYIFGKESLFYIKKLDEWIPVACIISSPLSENSEMMDTTTKDNGGWKTSLPTLQSYTIDISGVMVKDDEDSGNHVISYNELRSFKREGELIEWKIKVLNGWYIDSGKAYITDISRDDAVDGFITFSATLEGYGAPEEGTDKVYVLGNDSETEIYTHDDEQTVIQTN